MLGRYKKGIIISVVLALLIGLGYWMYIDYYKAPFEVKQEEFKYEYGEEVPQDVESYINILNDSKYEKTKDELVFNVPDGVKEDKVLAGEYDCSLEWRGQVSEFKVVVEDTKVPVITLKSDKVSIEYGSSYDGKSNVKSVTDEVDGDIKYTVSGTVNSKKAGDYTLTVNAEDVNGNKVSKEFTVTVKEKPKVEYQAEEVPSTVSSSGSKSVSSSSSLYPIKYSDSTSSITITKEWYGTKSKGAWCYIAHLKFSDYSRFFTACGNGKYGGKETIKHVANRLNTVLSVNGCYSSPNLDYGVARKGVLYNNSSLCNSPALYNSHTGILSYDEAMGISGRSLKSVVNAGLVTDTFCFGPRFLVNGTICNIYDTSSRAQRTFIGTNGSAGDIWLVVSDGRYIDGVSAGLTYKQCAQLLKDKGCTFGAPLDGGGSSTMVYKGKVLNKATGRAVVDSVNFK